MKQGQTNLFFSNWLFESRLDVFSPTDCGWLHPYLAEVTALHEQLIWRTDYETIMEICQNFLLQKCYEGLGENSCIDIESGLF